MSAPTTNTDAPAWAEALAQSEFGGDAGGPPFEWDIAINLGDYAGGFGVPHDEEGQEIVNQYGVLKKHHREQIYSLAGNHDATLHSETPTQWWFRKWIDPIGENPETSGVDPKRRPYPTTGSWERYSFRAGNLLFLLMSDRNDLPPPIGRGRIDARSQVGGYPAGAVTGETLRLVAGRGGIEPGCHHHLRTPPHAEGNHDRLRSLGGIYPPARWPLEKPLPWLHPPGCTRGRLIPLFSWTANPDAQAFERYLETNNSAIDFWLGAHTHLNPGRNTGNRRYLERKWGVTFINAAALSKYHNPLIVPPSSRLLTFTEGSDRVRVQYYLHTRDFFHQGWYEPEERTVQISKPFEWDPD